MDISMILKEKTQKHSNHNFCVLCSGKTLLLSQSSGNNWVGCRIISKISQFEYNQFQLQKSENAYNFINSLCIKISSKNYWKQTAFLPMTAFMLRKVFVQLWVVHTWNCKIGTFLILENSSQKIKIRFFVFFCKKFCQESCCQLRLELHKLSSIYSKVTSIKCLGSKLQPFEIVWPGTAYSLLLMYCSWFSNFRSHQTFNIWFYLSKRTFKVSIFKTIVFDCEFWSTLDHPMQSFRLHKSQAATCDS